MRDRKLMDAVLAICSGDIRHLRKPTKNQKLLFDIETYVGFDPLDGIREIFVNGYAEPGYGNDDNTSIVVLGNWNNTPQIPARLLMEVPSLFEEEYEDPECMVDVEHALDQLGVNIEWEDEWDHCAECSRLVRIHADCFSWRPYFWYSAGGECFCNECTGKDESLQELWLDTHNADQVDWKDIPFDLEDIGWVTVDDVYRDDKKAFEHSNRLLKSGMKEYLLVRDTHDWNVKIYTKKEYLRVGKPTRTCRKINFG